MRSKRWEDLRPPKEVARRGKFAKSLPLAEETERAEGRAAHMGLDAKRIKTLVGRAVSGRVQVVVNGFRRGKNRGGHWHYKPSTGWVRLA